MKSPMVTMLVKKIMRWGLLPLTYCAMTTVLLFSDITASAGEQPLAVSTIVIRYAAALLVGLVSEVCIYLVGGRLKKKRFYERIMNLLALKGEVSCKRCIVHEVRSARKLLTVGSATIFCWCYQF